MFHNKNQSYANSNISFAKSRSQSQGNFPIWHYDRCSDSVSAFIPTAFLLQGCANTRHTDGLFAFTLAIPNLALQPLFSVSDTVHHNNVPVPKFH